MAVIDQYRNILTVVAIYELDPSQVDEHVNELKSFVLNVAKGQPGFISSNLHVSLDKKRVVNYSQWKSEADYNDFWAKEEVQDKAKTFIDSVSDKTLMQVALAT